MTEQHERLLASDPVGMTMKDMLLRIDARMDRFEPRVRAIEDEQLIARTERKTILGLVGTLRSTILAAAALGPVIAGVLAYAFSSH
jgi:hypothetical protein